MQVAAREPCDAPVPLGFWPLVWRRFRRDRLALASCVFLVLIVLATVIGPPIASRLLGHGPNDLFPYAVDEVLLQPVGPWTRVPDTVNQFTGEAPPKETTLLVLGGDSQLGRDELLRLLVGGRVSLLVAIGGTLLAMAIGVTLGAAAAWFGGVVDSAVARLTEFVMAFPLLFFIILAGATFADRFDGITFGVLERGVVSLVLVIGMFTWFYPARIVRTEVLELREREFVEAARMVGAGEWRILRTHVLPHLVPTLIVYSTLLVATNILLEAGLSFLGVGIELPTASWGSLLSTSWGTIRSPNPFIPPPGFNYWITILPSLVILLVVVALNLLGEGLRAAVDPRGARR